MTTPLKSLIATGTKLWVDSIDPELVAKSFRDGASGATSNPIIISELIKTGRFDSKLRDLMKKGLSDEDTAWQMTDALVADAERVFLPTWEQTKGDDGYVSFELDPLLEDPDCRLGLDEKVDRYVEIGLKWQANHPNRMIKIPATPAGLAALEPLAEKGVALNVTLIFTKRQHSAACEAVWKGAQKRADLSTFKSAYSIFVSRVDVYTEKHLPLLSAKSQGVVGILNAKDVYIENKEFWKKRPTPLRQEIIFASTGTKKAKDAPWRYVAAFAGGDIETNPPATNEAVQQSGETFTAQIENLPPQNVIDEVAAKVDWQHLEETLMKEGIEKFVAPQKALLNLIAEKRAEFKI